MLIWNIDPEIFRLGSFAPRWYGLFFALGFVVGYLILAQIYRRERRSEENLSSLLLYILSGTIIGARLGHVLFYQPDYYLPRPWRILMIWQGGLASHGGFIGVLIAIYLYLKKYRDMSFLELADRLAIPSLLAASFIRIGNFFNSEIIGLPSELPWAMIPSGRRCSQTSGNALRISRLPTDILVACIWLIGRPRLSKLPAAFSEFPLSPPSRHDFFSNL